MSITGEFTNPEKRSGFKTSFDIYLLVQVNYTLTTQVLMPHSYGSMDEFHEIYRRTVLWIRKNKNEGLKAQEPKYSGLPRKKFRKYLKLHLEQESGHILKCNR